MSGPLRINDRMTIPEAELDFSFARSSAPGGQNVNKVNSKVWLRFDLAHSTAIPEDVRQRFLAQFPTRVTQEGHVLISAEEHRDRARNMDDACEKLRALLLAVATPPKARRKTRPTRGSVERRLQAKRATSERKRARGRDAD